jgi:hypothetical protein
VLFTHDNYLRNYAGTGVYAGRKVLLLVRHPADTAVSQYFQWKHRMKPRKKVINEYPVNDVPLQDFVFGESVGIPKVIRFMNRWAAAFDERGKLLVVRYESLHADTQGTLGRILSFLGEEATETELDECARFASVESMRKLEGQTFFRDVGDRIEPRDRANKESYKVRRGKVGGYRDYLDDDAVQRIDATVSDTLSPAYGYCGVPARTGIV